MSSGTLSSKIASTFSQHMNTYSMFLYSVDMNEVYTTYKMGENQDVEGGAVPGARKVPLVIQW